MSKYIDAEKLISEIERLLKCTEPHRGEAVADGSRQTLYWIKDFITSLQQEQPEVDWGEITPSFVENMLCEFGVQAIEDMDSEILAEFARHFWNKGFNARKEE